MPDLSFSVVILLIVAGFGAGVVTGLAGASAATVVTPLLVTFSPITAFTAIAISLITDVFASFFSFLTYRKNGNINIKDGMYLTIAACLGSLVGTSLSTNVDSLGNIGGAITLILGINFLRKGYRLYKNPDKVDEEPKKNKLSEMNPTLISIILGTLLGIVCGFIGAGGGLMILFVLTNVLRYDTKTAIGTSVLIMTFTALTGGIAHFFHMHDVNFLYLGIAIFITSLSAVIGAKIAATFANKKTDDILLMMVGTTFITITSSMIVSKVIFS